MLLSDLSIVTNVIDEHAHIPNSTNLGEMLFLTLQRSNCARLTPDEHFLAILADPIRGHRQPSTRGPQQQQQLKNAHWLVARTSEQVHQLLQASQDGDIETVQKILDEGVDVNSKNEYGWTALMKASSWRHIPVIELLMERNTKVDIQNKYGSTALIEASKMGYADVVQVLLDKNANVDMENEYGETALLVACCVGSLDCVKHLLQKGSDISIKNIYGETAKHIAKQYGHNDIVKHLTEYEKKK